MNYEVFIHIVITEMLKIKGREVICSSTLEIIVFLGLGH
jgi:hypothetical protein